MSSDTEIEKKVLGLLIVYYPEFSWAVGKLNDGDFSTMKHRDIFNGILKVSTIGKNVDPEVFYTEPGMGQYKAQIDELIYGTLACSGMEKSIEVLKLHHKRRDCSKFCAELAENISTMQDEDLVSRFESFAYSIRSSDSDRCMMHISEVGKEAMERYEQIANGKRVGLTTGFERLDKEFLHGFEKGKLYIIGGKPGCGKSGLMIDMARKCGGNVAIFSLEMDRAEIFDRYVSSCSGIKLGALKYSENVHSNFQEIVGSIETISSKKIWVNDDPEKTVASIVSDIRALIIKVDCEIAFIDYLQYIKPPMDFQGQGHEKFAAISKSLKTAAKHVNIPIVALSSINREEDGPRGLRMKNISGSGQIAFDAHAIMMLNRDESIEPSETEIIDLVIIKNRAGVEGKMQLRFEKARCRFEEVEF